MATWLIPIAANLSLAAGSTRNMSCRRHQKDSGMELSSGQLTLTRTTVVPPYLSEALTLAKALFGILEYCTIGSRLGGLPGSTAKAD